MTKINLKKEAYFKASFDNDLKTIQNLIKAGEIKNINVQNKNGDTVLIIAAHHGFIKIIEYLLQKKVNTKIKNNKGLDVLKVIAPFLLLDKEIGTQVYHDIKKLIEDYNSKNNC
jgi:ankyrin repeat protein